jgi:hypothetical protein
MDEHAEPRVAPPLHARFILCLGFVGEVFRRCFLRPGNTNNNEEKRQEKSHGSVSFLWLGQTEEMECDARLRCCFTVTGCVTAAGERFPVP